MRNATSDGGPLLLGSESRAWISTSLFSESIICQVVAFDNSTPSLTKTVVTAILKH